MNEKETITLNKDVTVLQLSIRRSRKGIVLQAKADPSLEDVFKEWSLGKFIPANTHGRLWEALNGPLPEAYSMGVFVPENFITPQGKYYRLERLGALLSDDYGTNISFLRLRGISEGEGVTFVIKGVYSTEALKKLAQDIRQAVGHFYLNFIKPVDVVINFQSQIQMNP